MVKTTSMTRNKNHDDASRSSRKRLKTSVIAPWSDLDHDLLFLIMMQLAVVDFVTFSGVCKSWRSLACSNWNAFMASKPPMTIHVSRRTYNKPCYLQEVDGRKFKTFIPNFACGRCFGLSSGYLIFFSKKTCNFWLVNPITRRELHFPDFPSATTLNKEPLRAVLVYSSSISEWVFAILCSRYVNEPGIWFSIMGKGEWIYVSSTIDVIDLLAFKGKIYALYKNAQCPLSQLILNKEPKLTSIKTKNFPSNLYRLRITSSSESIYVTGIPRQEDEYIILELDFGEMKWVSREKTMGEYAFFVSDKNTSVVAKPESWADPRSQYWRYADGVACCCRSNRGYELSGETRYFYAKMWYFPNQCLLNES